MESEHDRTGAVTDVEVGVVSGEPERLLTFYEQAFGFAPVSSFTVEAGTVYKLRADRARMKIFRPGTPPRSAPDEPLGARAGVAYFALYTDDLDSALDRAVAGGATVALAPTAHRPGARAALIRDPEGNVVELLEERGA